MRLSTLSLALFFGGPGMVAAQESADRDGPAATAAEDSENSEEVDSEEEPVGQSTEDAAPAPANWSSVGCPSSPRL